jgi:hypothetical protein
MYSVFLAPTGIRPPAPDLCGYARYCVSGVRHWNGAPRPSARMGIHSVLLAPTGIRPLPLAPTGIRPDKHPPRQPQAPGRKAADADAPPNGLRQPPLLAKWLTSGKVLMRYQRGRSPRFSGRLHALLGRREWTRLNGLHHVSNAPTYPIYTPPCPNGRLNATPIALHTLSKRTLQYSSSPGKRLRWLLNCSTSRANSSRSGPSA